jgi:hypothetical protein
MMPVKYKSEIKRQLEGAKNDRPNPKVETLYRMIRSENK